MNNNIKTTEEIKERFFDWKLNREESKIEKWVSFDWLSRVLLTYDTIEDVIKELQSELEG